jgi:pullulanase/glycogen debranching enzyme
MDVVFNHTAEGNEKGPIISFRGVDNSMYYMVAPKVFLNILILSFSYLVGNFVASEELKSQRKRLVKS